MSDHFESIEDYKVAVAAGEFDTVSRMDEIRGRQMSSHAVPLGAEAGWHLSMLLRASRADVAVLLQVVDDAKALADAWLAESDQEPADARSGAVLATLQRASTALHAVLAPLYGDAGSAKAPGDEAREETSGQPSAMRADIPASEQHARCRSIQCAVCFPGLGEAYNRARGAAVEQ